MEFEKLVLQRLNFLCQIGQLASALEIFFKLPHSWLEFVLQHKLGRLKSEFLDREVGTKSVQQISARLLNCRADVNAKDFDAVDLVCYVFEVLLEFALSHKRSFEARRKLLLDGARNLLRQGS